MTFDLVIISVSERAVQCALEDGSPAFWLPRKQVEWRGAIEPGEIVSAIVPRWLALKHQQLVASRMSTQKVLDLEKVELNPETAHREGSLPMAYDNNLSGALFKNDKRENDRHPLYKGSCEINGRKYWISAWLKTSERTGEKYMSLAFKPAEEQRQERPQPEPQNTYAAARGRDEPQQRPVSGPSFADMDEIPFAPDR